MINLIVALFIMGVDVFPFLFQKSPAKKWVLSSMFACKVPGDVREILDQVKLPLGLLGRDG